MIRGYVGLLGSGKTYSMVHDLVRQFRKEPVQVYTNMTSLKVPGVVQLPHDRSAVVGLTNGLIVLDEVQITMSSRYWQSVPKDVLSSLAQLRKHGAGLFFTTQDFARVDTVLRELTNEVVRCRRFGRWVLRITTAPESKDILGRSLVRIREDIGSIYDTLEVIGSDQAADGAMGALLVSRLAARRAAERRGPRNKGSAAGPFKFVDGNVLRVEDEKMWRDLLSDSPGASEAAKRWESENRRRKWLALFGIGPDEVPMSVCEASPNG